MDSPRSLPPSDASAHPGSLPVPLPAPVDRPAPVWVAPMAGGPSTPNLVISAWEAGHLAQLAAGYKTAEAMAREVREVKVAGVEEFGVNLFVPNLHRIDPQTYDAYAAHLEGDAARYELPDPLPALREDDDEWEGKIEALLADPVPLVSFTFGLPDRKDIAALREAGSLVAQTVTSPAEARAASAAGVDVLVVQGSGAGGHSGVWEPHRLPAEAPLPDLVTAVRAEVDLPIVAAGAVTTREDVRAALAAGAAAVSVGTAALRAHEAGTNALHRAALGDPRFTETVLTRAFTGRPARALVNRFVRDHDAKAPVGYPALHHLTKPLRGAATTAGDADGLNLWAGTGWRNTREAPVAEILAALVP
ncbi:nitronate monooxygenase [Brevibacterium samyangense]